MGIWALSGFVEVVSFVALFKILFIRMMGSFSRGALIRLGRGSEPGNEPFNILLVELCA